MSMHTEHGHSGTAGDGVDGGAIDAAMDPVCGMTVDASVAHEKGLHSRYHETDYYFCGKGCKLDFDEDPERYLDPGYVPSM